MWVIVDPNRSRTTGSPFFNDPHSGIIEESYLVIHILHIFYRHVYEKLLQFLLIFLNINFNLQSIVIYYFIKSFLST